MSARHCDFDLGSAQSGVTLTGGPHRNRLLGRYDARSNAIGAMYPLAGYGVPRVDYRFRFAGWVWFTLRSTGIDRRPARRVTARCPDNSCRCLVTHHEGKYRARGAVRDFAPTGPRNCVYAADLQRSRCAAACQHNQDRVMRGRGRWLGSDGCIRHLGIVCDTDVTREPCP